MKILEILPSADLAIGGPLSGALAHAEIWARQGHVCELVTVDPPDAPFLKSVPLTVHALGPDKPLPPKIRRFIPPLRYGYTPKLVPWLRRHLGDYDAVIVNGLWNYTILAARVALSGSTTPYYVFTHGMLDPWFRQVNPLKNAAKQAFWLFNEGPLANNARAVLFTTDEERIVSENAFWPYRVRERVVGYGTTDVEGDAQQQISAFRQAFPALEGRRFLLFLSRIHPKKGCDLLIRAFAKIARKTPDLDLVMAGPDQVGLVAQLRKIAEEEGIAERIHWPGMLVGDLKFGAFRACDAFALTSHQENFGVAVVEALACDKPVLISNKVNIWREIVEAKAGLVDDDTQDGSDRLLEAYVQLDEEEKRAMGVSARRLFIEKFHVEQAAKTLLAVIEKENSRDVHS